MVKIKKAVFPVAGLGTRFLPATKAMPKELLPVVDKPLLQYAAEEAISAGIDTLIFVTGRNKRAIEDHFDSNQELEMALRSKGMHEKAEMVRNILPKEVECIFVRQPEQLGLGHAVLCAERAVGSEPFAVLLADDFITYEGGGVISDLMKSFDETGKTQLSVMEVAQEETSKYGIVKTDKNSSKVKGIIEKPKSTEAPSNLASVGRYLLTPEIFTILRNLPKGAGDEIQLADAINFLAENDEVFSRQLRGKWFDCGSISVYLNAIRYIAKMRSL